MTGVVVAVVAAAAVELAAGVGIVLAVELAVAAVRRRSVVPCGEPVSGPYVRRRAPRGPVTVVLAGEVAFVEGACPDVVQLAMLDGGVEHVWDGSRWTFAAADGLAVAAALRAAGMAVRLASGVSA